MFKLQAYYQNIIMILISSTVFKRMAPKKGFTASYIRFPWNSERALIGKPVSIYKVEGGYFLSTEFNEFKPPNKADTEQEDACSMNDEFKPKESLKSRINTLGSQISTIQREIENPRIQANSKMQIVQNEPQNENVSGRSKPPSVHAAFSSAPYPGGYRAIHCPVLACTRRVSPFHRILFR